MDGKKLEDSINTINNLTAFNNFNIKESNREIANYFLDKNRYGLFNNFQ